MPRSEDHEVHKGMWWHWAQKKCTLVLEVFVIHSFYDTYYDYDYGVSRNRYIQEASFVDNIIQGTLNVYSG